MKFSKTSIALMTCIFVAACGRTASPESPAQSPEGNAKTSASSLSKESPDGKLLIEEYGDSVTAGELESGEQSLEAGKSGTALLEDALNQALGKNLVTVVNEGVRDSEASDLLNGTDGKHPTWQYLMKSSKAKIITLNFAVSDAYYLVKPAAGKESETPQRYREVMGKLVAIARASGKDVVLYAPNPTCDSNRGDSVKYYATQLDDLSKKSAVPMVGMYWETLKMRDWQSMLRDCTYPTQSLYQLRADKAYSVLLPLVKSRL